MKSMTGYGRSASSSKEVDIEVSVKTVNSRFLETRVTLPAEYATQENEIRAIAARHFSRGRVEISVRRKPGPESGAAGVQINEDLAKAYLDAFRALGKKLKLAPAKVGLDLLVRQPGVIQAAAENDISKTELKLLAKTVDEALRLCDAEREREGRSIFEEIQSILERLESAGGRIEGFREKANQALEERFRSRLAQLGFTGEAGDQRLWQEVSLQVEKSDIREEIVRLREHIRAYRDLIREKDPQGKKLDFYTQELLREANTIGSKSQVAELTQTVVEAKTWIEELREQVQNIE